MKNHKVDIVVVGGGSGGHITPLVSVAEALKDSDNTRQIVHIGHKNDPLNDVTRQSHEIDAVYEVSAGKFRRYHTHTFITKVLDVKTNLLNVRDFFRFVKGIFQAWRLLGKLQPRVIFMKGGYVCANVGYAAKLRGIPYITHDSDAMVSLAHKLIASDARLHLTALPPHVYAEYDQEKTIQVGIPVKKVFKRVSHEAQLMAKKELLLPEDSQFILVTGGGLGAQNINDGIFSSLEKLFQNPRVHLHLLIGNKLYDNALKLYEALPEEVKKRFTIEPFTHRMQVYSAAADVIVTRASMTAITEFGIQGKACVIVPNPLLAGGHQLKNAQALLEQNAVISVAEEDFKEQFSGTILPLLEDTKQMNSLGEKLHAITIPNAAEKIANQLDAVR